MFRIRLASGEEAEYHSVAELAQAIRNGRVPGNSEIFHRKSQRWLPISAHPAWDEAAPRPEEATGLGEGLAQPRPGEPVWGKTVRIYQMYSQSGREIEERRRPTWIAPVASLSAGLALVTALGFAIAPGSRVPDGTVRPVTTVTRVPGHTPAPALATITARNWPDAPYNLADRMGRAADSAARALADGFRRLGLRGMLTPERLGSLDSLRASRQALQAFRALLTRYREARDDLAVAYDDSATVLVKTGVWTGPDRREWDVRAVAPEPGADRARADSVLTLYDQLFGLLVDQAGSYNWEPAAVRFQTPEAGESYRRMREGLARFSTLRDPYGDKLSPPLALLLPNPGDTIPPAVLGLAP
jgi:hypothetical protein